MNIKQQAEQHLLHGQWEKAIAAYGKALESEPKNAELWNDRGVALHRLGRHEEAVKSYRQALRLDQQNKTILDNMKTCLTDIHGESDANYAMFAIICGEAMKKELGTVPYP